MKTYLLSILFFTSCANLFAQQTNLDFTGADQVYTVPTGISSITVKLWGAGGGGGDNNNTGPGGGAAFVAGNVCVTAGELLTIVVGGRGRQGGPSATSQTYGGGGLGRDYSRDGGSGGGRSAIIRGSTQLAIAGGGGGGGGSGTNAGDGSRYHGGAAGGVGTDGNKGGDRSNFSGGAGGCGGLNTGAIQNCNGGGNAVGSQGGDGESGSFSYGGGGGGGGYAGGEGGASGGNNCGGGGGASSYFSGTLSSSISGNSDLAGNAADVDNGNLYGRGGDRGTDGAQNGRVVIVTGGGLPAITGIFTACSNSSTQLSNTTGGGTWMSSTTGVATISNTGLVSGVTGGTTTISYSLTTACGTTSVNQVVTINSLPTVPAITGIATACSGSTTQLANTTTGGVWSTANGAIATVDNAGLVSGVVSGTTDISYAVTNTCGTTTVLQSVTISSSPTVPAITGTPTTCSGSTTQLANTTTGGVWSTANGAIATVDNAGLVSGVVSGTTDISYAVTNTCGTTTVLQSVTISSLPVIDSVVTTGALCGGGNTGSLTVYVSSGSPAYSYSNDNGQSFQNGNLFSGLVSGNYPVVVKDNLNCVSSASSATIQSSPGVSITAGNTNTSCGISNGTATVTVTSGAAIGYLWSNGDTTASVSNLTGAVYSVTALDVDGCSATASVTVDTSAAISVSISSDKIIMCSGDSAHVCAPSGFSSYVWNTGATSFCIDAKLAGNYYVTVSDNNNCTAASNHLAINIHPIPSVSISVNSDTLTAYNSSSYQWFYNGNNIAGATSGIYIAQQSGAYTVQVTDTNGCTALSNAVNVVVTEVNEIFKNQTISVYPNPASTNLTLQVPTEFIGQSIEIIDITGQLVFRNFISQPKSTIDVSKLARGIYFLRCGNSLRKIVLE